MGKTIFHQKNIIDTVSTDHDHIQGMETETRVLTPITNPTVSQVITFQFQSTSFTKISDDGDARVYPNTATSSINEETEATVAAYATFDDVGGNAPVAVLSSTEAWVPILDGESKVAYYHSHPLWSKWDNTIHPEVVHTKQFMVSHSASMNVPGTNANDKAGFIRYDSNAAFNISANVSVSLWFYPTDLSTIASETYRVLFYRRIDASNSFMIMIKPSDSKVYVFVNEAAATTKLVSSAAVNLNAWNLIIFTYNPTTNALVIYLNNSSSSSTPGDSLPAPYTTDAHMYIAGLPSLPDKRYTGYIDNFVFWTGKILTSTEAGNMWNHGTIV